MSNTPDADHGALLITISFHKTGSIMDPIAHICCGHNDEASNID